MIISFSILYFLLLYLVIFIAYVGWGKIFSSIVNIRLEGNGICFSNAWLGWALSLVIFHSIHLFYPLTPAVSGLFFLLGIYFYLRKKGHAQQPSSIVIVSRTYVAALLIFSFCVASYAIMSPDVYDSGLYHFNSIRWLQEYAIVPGLGNLHGRLAYNNTFFGYIASLNAFPPFSYGHNLGNSFLLILVFAECLYPIFHRRAQNCHVSQLVIITKVCLIPLLLVYSIDRFSLVTNTRYCFRTHKNSSVLQFYNCPRATAARPLADITVKICNDSSRRSFDHQVKQCYVCYSADSNIRFFLLLT